jgi:hypothetical protein
MSTEKWTWKTAKGTGNKVVTVGDWTGIVSRSDWQGFHGVVVTQGGATVLAERVNGEQAAMNLVRNVIEGRVPLPAGFVDAKEAERVAAAKKKKPTRQAAQAAQASEAGEVGPRDMNGTLLGYNDIVVVVQGPHAGKVVLYDDDDDTQEKLILYANLNYGARSWRYIMARPSDVRIATAEEHATWWSRQRTAWERMSPQKLENDLVAAGHRPPPPELVCEHTSAPQES